MVRAVGMRPMTESRRRILLYCYSGLGIGHLSRTLLVAHALLEEFAVGLIIGGEIPCGVHIDPRVSVFALPAVRATTAFQLLGANGAVVDDRIVAARTELAVDAVREFGPDVLIVEMFPFGRKKLAAEILALIAAARLRGCAKVFCSVRDILITTRRDQAAHDTRAVQRLNELFDGVLVHSDPSFTRLDATFSRIEDLRIPLVYTGYVARTPPAAATRIPRIVVSAGGGRVGAQLLRVALEAYALMHIRTDYEMVAIAGPHASNGQLESLRVAGLTLCDFEPQLNELLAASWLSISQCGYNTATDVLGSGIPAIFVPYETPSENEQSNRAARLSSCGRAQVLSQATVTPEELAAAILAMPRSEHASSIDLSGAESTRDYLLEAVA